jgi:transposase
MPWAPAEALVLSAEQRAELQRLVRAPSTPQKVVMRAKVVLAAAAGRSNSAIASELAVSRPTVILWRQRMATHGLEGILADATRPGRRKVLSAELVARVVEATLNSKPPGGTHWSIREMAAAQQLSPAAVQRIWRAHGLKPHLVQGFKLSSDPHFEEKVRDIVGLYLKPPDAALVLCVDEKTQIQAIDRTHPVLALRPGIPERQSHDYARHGTTSLYAALNVLSGQVIGRCLPRHTQAEFLAFLRLIDRSTAKRFDLHLIVDNSSTHSTPAVKAWLAAHPRFVLHFTPTSSSWLNLVERWFAELARRRLKRGTFASVPELTRAIEEHIALNNAHPKPFEWHACADEILGKVARCKEALDTEH